MNKVILMGRLTADPELKSTSAGTSYCNFSIAVNRRFAKEGQQTVDFINCTAWSKTAEFLAKYFGKGQMLALCGRIEQNRWEQDGTVKYAYNVAAEELYFTGSKNEPGDPLDNASHNAEKYGFTDFDKDDTDMPF